MKTIRWFLIGLVLTVTATLRAGDFIELVISAPPPEGIPKDIPAKARAVTGSVYLNLENVEKVYFNAQTHTADIYTPQSVFLVKFSNVDSRTIFRAVLSKADYKAVNESREELVKEVASKAGFVPVAYLYELPRGGR